MRKLILIALIATTSIGCPSKNKNSSPAAAQVVVNPNQIQGNCQNSYYNPQTGQMTSYNQTNGWGINTVGGNCAYGNGGFGGYGYGGYFYPSNVTSYGIQCGTGYYGVYASSWSGCVSSSWANSYAMNAYVYSYYNSGWIGLGYYGTTGWGATNAFRGCSYSFNGCNCAMINNTGFGVCL